MLSPKPRFFIISIISAAIAVGAINYGFAEMSDGSKELEMANHAMHAAMTMEMTGDVDKDFARGMIPHHQGAIDMAKIVLKYGKDPEIRKLAEAIVGAQESEISFMKEWLAKNGG